MLRAWSDFLAAGLLLAAGEAVLFHGGAYFGWLEPQSHSAALRRLVDDFDHALEGASPERPLLLLIGNSQVRSGLQEERLEAGLGGRYRVVNLAKPGSSPAAWRIQLGSLPLEGDRVHGVVLGVSSLNLRPAKPRDLEIVKTELRIRDAPVVAGWFTRFEPSARAAAAAWVRTPLFASDLRDFLAAPGRRIERAKEASRRAAERRRRERHRNTTAWDLSAARLDRKRRLVVEELPLPLQRLPRLLPRIEELLRSPDRDGAPAPRMLEALEGLVESLHARGVAVYLTDVPRSPYPAGRRRAPELIALASRLEREGPLVAFLSQPGLLETLEDPRYFRDALHLNERGADRFTDAVAAGLSTSMP